MLLNPPLLAQDECRTDPGFQPLTYDRVVGINNLYNIAWLRRGLEVAPAVARIVLKTGERATGFRIEGDRLLTNHHVLGTPEDCRSAEAQFNVENDWDGQPKKVTTCHLDASAFFVTDRDLDFTVVAIKDPPKAKDFPELHTTSTAALSVNDYVNIIQHPDGGPKMICLTDNKVQAVFDNKLQYCADTSHGSSGAPIFDKDWALVGMHRRGGLLAGPTGAQHWVNEGVTIGAILAAVEKARSESGVMTAIAPTSMSPPSDLYYLVFAELRSVVADLLAPANAQASPTATSKVVMGTPRFRAVFERWIGEQAGDSSVTRSAAKEGCACGVAFDAVVRPIGHESLKVPFATRGLHGLDRAGDVYRRAHRTLDGSDPDRDVADTLDEIEAATEGDDLQRAVSAFLEGLRAGGERGSRWGPCDPRDERWPRRPR